MKERQEKGRYGMVDFAPCQKTGMTAEKGQHGMVGFALCQ